MVRTPWLRHCAAAPCEASCEAPDPTIDTHRAYTRGTVEYVTFPTGRITGLQSADCIEMIEIHDGGGEIETRVRESCCTVAHVYSSYESDAARLRSAPYTAVLIRMGPTLKEEEEKERLVVQGTIGTSKDIWG